MRRGSVKPRVTYANAMSSIAVFLALGGVGYAATSLPANSVGSTQLKSGSVTNSKLANATITQSKLSAATIASLKGQKGDTGATGVKGNTGDPGPKGDSGIAGHIYVIAARSTFTTNHVASTEILQGAGHMSGVTDSGGNATGTQATFTLDRNVDGCAVTGGTSSTDYAIAPTGAFQPSISIPVAGDLVATGPSIAATSGTAVRVSFDSWLPSTLERTGNYKILVVCPD